MKKNIAAQLGFWTSVFIAAGGGIYSLILIYSFSTEGFANPNIPIPTGPIAWGPILLALSILLSVYFRKLSRQVS